MRRTASLTSCCWRPAAKCQLCVEAYEQLDAEGVKARVVSMPSWELFERQPLEYRETVLPPAVTARVSVEQASVLGWDRYVGPHGRMIGMHTFGASAPLKEVQKFGTVRIPAGHRGGRRPRATGTPIYWLAEIRFPTARTFSIKNVLKLALMGQTHGPYSSLRQCAEYCSCGEFSLMSMVFSI
jgi:hypothetical protein